VLLPVSSTVNRDTNMYRESASLRLILFHPPNMYNIHSLCKWNRDDIKPVKIMLHTLHTVSKIDIYLLSIIASNITTQYTLLPIPNTTNRDTIMYQNQLLQFYTLLSSL